MLSLKNVKSSITNAYNTMLNNDYKCNIIFKLILCISILLIIYLIIYCMKWYNYNYSYNIEYFNNNSNNVNNINTSTITDLSFQNQDIITRVYTNLYETNAYWSNKFYNYQFENTSQTLPYIAFWRPDIHNIHTTTVLSFKYCGYGIINDSTYSTPTSNILVVSGDIKPPTSFNLIGTVAQNLTSNDVVDYTDSTYQYAFKTLDTYFNNYTDLLAFGNTIQAVYTNLTGIFTNYSSQIINGIFTKVTNLVQFMSYSGDDDNIGSSWPSTDINGNQSKISINYLINNNYQYQNINPNFIISPTTTNNTPITTNMILALPIFIPLEVPTTTTQTTATTTPLNGLLIPFGVTCSISDPINTTTLANNQINLNIPAQPSDISMDPLLTNIDQFIIDNFQAPNVNLSTDTVMQSSIGDVNIRINNMAHNNNNGGILYKITYSFPLINIINTYVGNITTLPEYLQLQTLLNNKSGTTSNATSGLFGYFANKIQTEIIKQIDSINVYYTHYYLLLSASNYQSYTATLQQTTQQDILNNITNVYNAIINNFNLQVNNSTILQNLAASQAATNKSASALSSISKSINDIMSYINIISSIQNQTLGLAPFNVYRPVAPSGYKVLGDIIACGKDLDIITNNNLYACIPEQCFIQVRPWRTTDLYYEMTSASTGGATQYLGFYLNPYTNTFKVVNKVGLPDGMVEKVVACVAKCSTIDNLISQDKCIRNMAKKNKDILNETPVINTSSMDAETEYYEQKIAKQAQLLKDLKTQAKSMQIENNKIDIINKESNRSQLQSYIDEQKRNIDTIMASLIHSQNKIDVNIMIPANLRIQVIKQVVDIINGTTLPASQKEALAAKALNIVSPADIKSVLANCPTYDLSNLVKKSVASDVCYGCAL